MRNGRWATVHQITAEYANELSVRGWKQGVVAAVGKERINNYGIELL